MKYLIFMLLAAVMSCDDPIETDDCWTCVTDTTKVLCSGAIEKYSIEETFCGWAGEQKQQYEAKNTFILEEKCFTMYQTCKCTQ